MTNEEVLSCFEIFKDSIMEFRKLSRKYYKRESKVDKFSKKLTGNEAAAYFFWIPLAVSVVVLSCYWFLTPYETRENVVNFVAYKMHIGFFKSINVNFGCFVVIEFINVVLAIVFYIINHFRRKARKKQLIKQMNVLEEKRQETIQDIVKITNEEIAKRAVFADLKIYRKLARKNPQEDTINTLDEVKRIEDERASRKREEEYKREQRREKEMSKCSDSFDWVGFFFD